MITKNERILVEAIRQSSVLTIVIPGNADCGASRIRVSGRLFSHDVALVLQSHFNRSSK